VKDYVDTGKARIVFKDFPLNIHPQAQKAAEAALCVKEQLGDMGYFRMHDKLFENQENLSIDNFKKWARGLDSSGIKFDQCLDSGKYASKVKENLAYGQQLGVVGTPTFFINGKPVRGAQPYEVIKSVIDAELKVTA
jgi:protein-disulfide isomerase